MCAWYQRTHLVARDRNAEAETASASFRAAACLPHAIGGGRVRICVVAGAVIRVNL